MYLDITTKGLSEIDRNLAEARVLKFLLKYRIDARKTLPEKMSKKSIEMMVEFGIIGELGEVIDLLKKALFQGHTIDTEKLTLELGDCFWYLFVNIPSDEMAKVSESLVSSLLYNEAEEQIDAQAIQFYAKQIIRGRSSEIRPAQMAALCISLNIDPFDAMRANIEKLRKRYGNKFIVDRSINRVDE